MSINYDDVRNAIKALLKDKNHDDGKNKTLHDQLLGSYTLTFSRVCIYTLTLLRVYMHNV